MHIFHSLHHGDLQTFSFVLIAFVFFYSSHSEPSRWYVEKFWLASKAHNNEEMFLIFFISSHFNEVRHHLNYLWLLGILITYIPIKMLGHAMSNCQHIYTLLVGVILVRGKGLEILRLF